MWKLERGGRKEETLAGAWDDSEKSNKIPRAPRGSRTTTSPPLPTSYFYPNTSSRMTASRMRSPQDSRFSKVAESNRASVHSGNSPNFLCS